MRLPIPNLTFLWDAPEPFLLFRPLRASLLINSERCFRPAPLIRPCLRPGTARVRLCESLSERKKSASTGMTAVRKDSEQLQDQFKRSSPAGSDDVIAVAFAARGEAPQSQF